MKRTTIKDLARQFGVNPSTISRALNNHPDVGDDLKNRIQAAAQQSGYRPNRMAASFRNRRSRLIGLIVPQVSMFFFPSIIKGVEEVARAKGYSLIVLHSSDRLEREIENVQICFENNVDGLLVALTKETKSLDHFDLLREAEIPIVFFDKILETADQHAVVIDDLAAAAVLAHILTSARCSRVLGIFGDPNLTITQKRKAGFEQALAGCPADVRELFAESSSQSKQLTQAVLADGFVPDGLFAMSDETLLGAVAALGTEVLSNCKIVCFSDGLMPDFLNIPIAYVRHSGHEIGQTAMIHLLDLLSGDREVPSANVISIPTNIIQK